MSTGQFSGRSLSRIVATALAAVLGLGAPLLPGSPACPPVQAQEVKGQPGEGQPPETAQPKAKGRGAAKALEDETKEEKDMSSKKAKKAKKAAPARTGGHTIRSKPLED